MEHFKNVYPIIDTFITSGFLIEINEIVQLVSVEMTKNSSMLFAFRAMVFVKDDFFELGLIITEDLENEWEVN